MYVILWLGMKCVCVTCLAMLMLTSRLCGWCQAFDQHNLSLDVRNDDGATAVIVAVLNSYVASALVLIEHMVSRRQRCWCCWLVD